MLSVLSRILLLHKNNRNKSERAQIKGVNEETEEEREEELLAATGSYLHAGRSLRKQERTTGGVITGSCYSIRTCYRQRARQQAVTDED